MLSVFFMLVGDDECLVFTVETTEWHRQPTVTLESTQWWCLSPSSKRNWFSQVS